MKFVRNAALALIFLLMAAPFIFPIFDPWSEINCRRQWINIESGKARFERYVWFIKVFSRDEETALSKAIGTTIAKDEAWRLVNTYGPLQRHSPHHRFYGALSQISIFEVVADDRKWAADKRREVSLEIMARWKTGGHYSIVDNYLQEQYELTLANKPQEKR